MSTPSSLETSDAPSALYHNVPIEIKTATRLLTLHRGSGKDTIACSLTTVDLETNPQYEALSYCWGSPNQTVSVLLENVPVNVRDNLWRALWHLRLVHRDRVLWVDALCINQENVRERNHQVGLMNRIYSKAVEVLVWLGPASRNSDKAMDCLADYVQVGNDFISAGRIKNGAAHREAVADLCKREYWRRMWILQEYGLATAITIHCGGKSARGGAFAYYCLGKVSASEKEAVKPLLDYREARYRRNDYNSTLIGLLAAFNTRQCADPRDTVFALLGMASDCRNSNSDIAVMADYSQSLFGTYMNVCRTAIETRKPGTMTTQRSVLIYNQVLQLYMQCAFESFHGGMQSKTEWDPDKLEKKGFDDWKICEFKNENAEWKLASFLDKKGLEEMLKWLEAPRTRHVYNDNAASYDQPKARRTVDESLGYRFLQTDTQIAKLQLLIVVLGRQSRLRITVLAEYTEILVLSELVLGRDRLVEGALKVDHESSVVKVLWKREEIEALTSYDVTRN